LRCWVLPAVAAGAAPRLALLVGRLGCADGGRRRGVRGTDSCPLVPTGSSFVIGTSQRGVAHLVRRRLEAASRELNALFLLATAVCAADVAGPQRRQFLQLVFC